MAGKFPHVASFMIAEDNKIDKGIVLEIWNSLGLPATVEPGREKPVLDELRKRGLMPAEDNAGKVDHRKAPRVRPEVLEGLAGMKAICSYSLDIANIAWMRKNGSASAYIDGLIFADRKARGDIVEEVDP